MGEKKEGEHVLVPGILEKKEVPLLCPCLWGGKKRGGVLEKHSTKKFPLLCPSPSPQSRVVVSSVRGPRNPIG